MFISNEERMGEGANEGGISGVINEDDEYSEDADQSEPINTNNVTQNVDKSLDFTLSPASRIEPV